MVFFFRGYKNVQAGSVINWPSGFVVQDYVSSDLDRMWKRNIYGFAILAVFFNTPIFSLSAVLTCWFLTGIVKVSLNFVISNKF